MKVTVITMYRGYDAQMFCYVVEGELTPEQKIEWRKRHECDEFCDSDDEDQNNMFFRVTKIGGSGEPTRLLNVDGEQYPD